MCHRWWLFLTAIVRRKARLWRTEKEVETLKETGISHFHLSVTRVSDKISSGTKDLVWFTLVESTWQKGYGGRDAGVEWGAEQEPGTHRIVIGTHHQLSWRNSTNLAQSCGFHCLPNNANGEPFKQEPVRHFTLEQEVKSRNSSQKVRMQRLAWNSSRGSNWWKCEMI